MWSIRKSACLALLGLSAWVVLIACSGDEPASVQQAAVQAVQEDEQQAEPVQEEQAPPEPEDVQQQQQAQLAAEETAAQQTQPEQQEEQPSTALPKDPCLPPARRHRNCRRHPDHPRQRDA